jgi:hypothetical protein
VIFHIGRDHFWQGYRPAMTADAAARGPYTELSQLFVLDHKRQKLTVRFEPQNGNFWLGSLARTALPANTIPYRDGTASAIQALGLVAAISGIPSDVKVVLITCVNPEGIESLSPAVATGWAVAQRKRARSYPGIAKTKIINPESG